MNGDGQNNRLIEPIGEEQRRVVVDATRQWILRAAGIWRRDFPMLPVLFDLRGRAAGMYRVARRQRVIRYNPWLFAKYPEDNLSNTVPHEVAHYITDCLHGMRRIRPHGVEWRQVMMAFGVEACAGTRHDLAGIPVRRQQLHAYRCACMQHQLTTRRHHRVLREGVYYVCRHCGGRLRQETLESSASQRV